MKSVFISHDDLVHLLFGGSTFCIIFLTRSEILVVRFLYHEANGFVNIPKIPITIITQYSTIKLEEDGAESYAVSRYCDTDKLLCRCFTNVFDESCFFTAVLIAAAICNDIIA